MRELLPYIYIGLSLFVANVGKGRKTGYFGALVICLIISPLIGYWIVKGFFTKTTYKCKWCNHVIYEAASSCPKCLKNDAGEMVIGV